MKIVTLDENYIADEGKTAVAIGKFDGIHKGHNKLLERLLRCKADGYRTVVFTFEKSISAFFNKEEPQLIATESEKIQLLEEMGIDILAVYPVNAESMGLEPKEFVEKVLIGQLNAGIIAAGPDCSYGAGGRGDTNLLNKLSQQYGYELITVDKIFDDGKEISSTGIREQIKLGNMEKVESLLGRAYSLSGTVIHGKKLGRTIGMPTANLIPDRQKLLPPNGVYYSLIKVGDREYRGISNLGVKPTVDDEKKVSLETFIYDFNENLYGREITVSLIHFRRPEMKFESIEALKKQMEEDIKASGY